MVVELGVWPSQDMKEIVKIDLARQCFQGVLQCFVEFCGYGFIQWSRPDLEEGIGGGCCCW